MSQAAPTPTPTPTPTPAPDQTPTPTTTPSPNSTPSPAAETPKAPANGNTDLTGAAEGEAPKGPGTDLTGGEEAPGEENSGDDTPNELVGAPEADYESPTLPDGLTMDPDQWAQFAPLARDMNLSQAGVQKLIDFEVVRVQQQHDQWAATTSSWRDEWRADPELGGRNSAKTLASAQAALRKFGDPSLTSFLDQGYGNHPALVRLFANIGKAFAEPEPTGGAPAVTPRPKDLTERMYGSDK